MTRDLYRVDKIFVLIQGSGGGFLAAEGQVGRFDNRLLFSPRLEMITHVPLF